MDPFSCSSTHVWDFFPWVCQCRKTMEGGHFSCLDVKEPKKISLVPRFHQITPKNKARKSKKIGNEPFFMFKYPCLKFFSVGVPVTWDNGRRPFLMFGRQGTQKKNSPVPRFRQITTKNKAWKFKKIGNRPFFMFKYPCLGFFCVGVPVPWDNGGRPFLMFGHQRTQKK